MTADFQFLVPDPTPWEKVIEQTSGERWLDVDADIIRRFKNPDECPEHLLSFLAFERSVDLWDDSWTIEKKRHVIKLAPEHHRHKGTAWIIGEYLRLIGARAHRITTPPQKAFCGVPMTDEDYQTWLARLPQIRIYPNAPPLLRPMAPASLSSNKTRRSFFGRAFFVQGTPVGYRRRVSEYVDNGVTTALSWSEVENRSEDGTAYKTEYVTLPAKTKIKKAFFGTAFFGRGYVGNIGIGERVISFSAPVDVTDPRYFATRKVVQPTDDLVSLVPERVSIPAPVPPLAAIRGRAFGRVALIDHNLWRYTYDRLYVNAPERWAGIDAGRPRGFMGRARFNMPAYTAEVTVDLSFSRKPRRMGRFAGAFAAPVEDRVAKTRQALVMSKALRDTIKIITNAHRVPTVGDGIPVGTLRIGDMIAS